MILSFIRIVKERKDWNVLLNKTEKNAKIGMFLYKERKRTQRWERMPNPDKYRHILFSGTKKQNG